MANPLLTDEQNRRLANQNSTYNQIMQGFAPVQQPQEDSWLGGLSRGAKAGFGGVGAGLLHAGQAAFGTDGSLAAGFDAMAKNNAQRREWDLADTLSLDYLTNPEGLAYGIGQIAGSMALPALFGAGVAAAVPTGGTSLLGTGALIGAAGAAPMAISEGGNTYAQGLQQGMTEDEAKKAGLTDAAIKLPFYMLSEGLSGKVAQGLISKGLLNAEGKSLGRRAAESGAKILGNAANEAYEEGTENRSSAYALGDQRISSLGNIFNPFDWNEEDKAQAVGVFTPTLALGALTGGAGHLRSRFDKNNSDVAEEIASEDGGTIEEAPESNVSGREAFINAIAGQESEGAGGYEAENGDTKAYGKYQILPSNWPKWAAEAGLSADAPQTPENQEIVARFKLGQYYDKYGARGAAIAWYGGEGALNYSDEALNRKQGDNGEYPSINEYADEVLGRMGNVADSVRIDDTIDDTEENYFDESNYTDDTIPDSLNPVRGFDVSHIDKGTAQDRNSLLYGERVKKAKPAPASEEVASFNQSLDNSNAQKAPNSLFVNSPRSWDAAERIYKARAKEQAERKARAQAIANIANAQQQSFLNVLRNRAAQQWDNAEQEYKDRKQDKLQSLANVINARAAQKWDAKEADNAQKARAEQEKQAQLQNIARLLDARAAQQWDNAERDANLKQNQAQALANLLNAKAAGQYDVAQQVYANRAKEQVEKQRQQQAIANIINARAAQKFDEAETADKFKFVPQRQSMYDGAMRRNLAAQDKVKPEEQPSVEPTERNGAALDKRNMLDVTLPKVREQHKWDKEHKEYHAERYGESALPQTQLLSTDRAARRNMPKPGIEARNFINDRAEKKNARERMQDAIAFVWKDDPKHPLKACRRQLNMFRDMRKEYLQPIYDVMAEGAGNGVSRIPIIEFDNQHRGRFYRQSNNSPWYAKYFKEHKKKPTQKAMYDIAEEVAFGENADVGYYAGVQGKELEAIVAENHAQLDPINDYIQTYESLELRLKENPNYGKEQAERINKAEEARRAEKRNAGETASAESIQTEAKQPAGSNQDEVNKKAPALAEGKPKLEKSKEGYYIANTKDDVISILKPLVGQEFKNENNGDIVTIGSTGINKLVSNAATRKSIGNGYTLEEHNTAAANIVKLFKDSVLKETHDDYKVKNGEHSNIKDIRIYQVDYAVNGKPFSGKITVKETVQHGKKLYSIELMEIEKPEGMLEQPPNNQQTTPASGLSTQSVAQPAENVKKLNLPKGTTVDVSIVGDNSNIIQVKFNGAQGKGTGGIMGRAGYKWKSDKQVWQARKTEKAMDVAEQLGYTEEAKPQERDYELERDELWDTFATKLGIDNILSVDKANEELKGVEGLHDGAIVYYDNNNRIYHIISKESDPEMLKLGYNYDVSTFDIHHMPIRAGAVKTADEVIKRVTGRSEQKAEPKAKPSADAFSKNPDALVKGDKISSMPLSAMKFIKDMFDKGEARQNAKDAIRIALFKSKDLEASARNNTYDNFKIAYFDAAENYLADNVDNNPAYAKLLESGNFAKENMERAAKETYNLFRVGMEKQAESKPAEKQETKEPAARFDGERARKSLDALIGRKKKNEPQKNDVVPKSKFMNVFNEDELDAEIEKAKKEMSKLSANPMFNPALMKSLFKIGGIYLQKGVNKFAAWADNMVDVMGEKVRPFLPAVWDSLKKYPDNQKFNDDVMTAVMEYVGEGVDNGKSLSAIKREFADDYGDEYLGYVDAAFEGVKKYPTSDNVADVVESKQDNTEGGKNNANNTERLQSVSEGGTAETVQGLNGKQDIGGVRGQEVSGSNGLLSRNNGATDAGQSSNARGLHGESTPQQYVSGTSERTDKRNDVPQGLTPAQQADAKAEETPGHNFTIKSSSDVADNGKKKKYQGNIAAIKLLKKLESEGRMATPAEQKVLAKYIGWGPVQEVFSPKKYPEWESEYNELKELLTPQEWSAARESVLTAFFTPPAVIDSVYKVVQHLGFKGGKVLDPSMGHGNYFGAMPTRLRKNCMLRGVELDPITGAMAKQLYQDASVEVTGFENAYLDNNSYDLVISNVPFNTNVHPIDRDFKTQNFNLHNYFFAKAVQKARPGGLIVFITSENTMKSDSASLRKYLEGKADFIGAMKLPDTTFKSYSGTAVTSDLIILQKRDESGKPNKYAQEWLDSSFKRIFDKTGTYIAYGDINEYYAKHPGMVIGEWGKGNYSSLIVKGGDLNVADEIAKRAENLPKNIYKPLKGRQENSDTQTSTVSYLKSSMLQQGSLITDENGIPMVKSGNKVIPFGDKSKRTYKKDLQCANDYIRVRDVAKTLLDKQLDPNVSDEELSKYREELNTVYDNFVANNGALNAKGKLLSGDPDYGLICAIENYSYDKTSKKGTATKTAIFTTRTVNAIKPATSAATVNDALALSLSNKGRLDIEYMQELLPNKPTEKEIVKSLGDKVFKDPATDSYVMADEYLSGNVREKLEQAKLAVQTNRDYAKNVKALEKVIPQDWTEKDIKASLGSAWIPAQDVEQFARELMGSKNGTVTFIPSTGTWVVDMKGSDYGVKGTQQYGTSRRAFGDILSAALNQKTIEIKTQGTPDVKESDLANAMVKKVQEEFEKWIWSDESRKKRLLHFYNNNFNATVLRNYDGSMLNLPGYSALAPKLRGHQKDAIWRIIQNGTCLLAHCVGAGKTWTMQAAAMEMKRLGLISKPMFTVPNHMVEQFTNEFRQIYPNAKLLVLTAENLPEIGGGTSKNPAVVKLNKAKRKSTLAKIATEDWDGIIISHELFKRIPMSAKAYEEYYQQQADEIEQALSESADSDENYRTTKELEKKLASAKDKMKKAMNEVGKDLDTPFDKLGIDQIFVDEADLFKNLAFTTNMGRVAGISNSNSQRSQDMYIKTQYLLNTHNGRGVVFATGTPISNSIAEMFTMLRYLNPQALKNAGVSFFDNFISTFSQKESTVEPKPDGNGYRIVQKFTNFYNASGMKRMFREVADVKTQAEINVKIPKLKNGERTVTELDITAPLKQYITTTIKERADSIRNNEVDPSEDNMLKLTSDLRKASLDLRLIDGYQSLPTEIAAPKILAVADNAYNKYVESNDVKGTQLIFCDLSTPKGKSDNELAEGAEEEVLTESEQAANNSVYTNIAKELIRKGIPKNEIAYIHDAKTNEQKEELFAKVRSGEIRILIGSTSKMGAGTNCQRLIVAEHHVDCPWRPRDIEQREGRALRQGNLNDEVEIFTYVTKDSFDTNMWEKVKTKSQMIGQAMNSDLTINEIEDIGADTLSYAEIQGLASGDPFVPRRIAVSAELNSLRNQYREYEDNRKTNERTIRDSSSYILALEKEAETAKKDAEKLRNVIGENFSIVIAGKTFTKFAEAEKVLEGINQKVGSASVIKGNLAGLDFKLYYMPKGTEYRPSYKNSIEWNRTASLGGYVAEFASSDPNACYISLGKLRAMVNMVTNGIPSVAQIAEEEIRKNKAAIKEAKEALNLPFDKEAEYKKLLEEEKVIAKHFDAIEKAANVGDNYRFNRVFSTKDGKEYRSLGNTKIEDAGGNSVVMLESEDTETQETVWISSDEIENTVSPSNTQYSVSSEAVQRAKEEVEAEIRAAFPNGKVEYVNGVPTITMPNGSKFQYSIRENIVVNAKEQRKADAAHGTSGARVQGFWKKFTGNGVQRMLAVSKNSERGTAFHEAMHAAIDLVLTEKEKNALYNYYEKKAKEQNRDVDEVIADAYRDWVLARQRKSGTMFGKLWRKVKDFCIRIKAIFDKGAEVERIMQDIESGRVYERGTNNHSVTKRISFSKEEIQGQKGSGTTQVATTRTMYVKALKWLRNQYPEAKTVLDYGAGLGLGTDDMRSNNPDLNIDCYEPNPERWAGKQPPTYTNNTQINKDYDLILNTNVLNVVEKPIRDLIVKDIADHLTMGGKALITTRGWSNDVNAAKNFKPADEHHAIWINKGKNGYVFQKGFDGDELKNYIEELLGDEFVVEKTRPTFGKSSVTITRVKAQPNKSAKQLGLFDTDSYQEMPDSYKTLKGSVVKRSKYGVGKQMGSQVYLHKDYVSDVIPKKVWENALKVLSDAGSDFEYNCVMYDTKTGNVRFDEAPDFDESREPIVGDTITVKPDGTVKRGHSNYIWHHKWLWVKNDYQGFDVNQSKAWSNKWLGTLTETADGNGIERWNTQLDRFNLEHDGEEVHYSVASPKHKIANAFTNTERKGVVDSAKDFFKEHRKSLYQDWFDKNNPLKGFDALTKATGGLSVYDQVQSLPATTAGMLKALTEGTAQHVKMANQHLKNVKMKYNVTLAMALEKIDKKQMDKAYPKYLAENGFDNWVNALGAYLGAERCLEMARLARAEGKTYKFPKGLTEQECQDFVNKAPQQFKAAADIFYKVNDNVISIMEDAEVFSHDLAKTLRTKYRKYCPLLRDFSDTAAADSFIGGLTEGGRGIGNVSVPLKRINIEGSERGVLNPLETILKSYAVMLNRAERNKVALMAVENSRTADLHELIQEVPGTTADPKNCVFTVLINGKKKAYKTTQDLYGPIVGYNLPAANLAFGVARTAARMLRTGATMSPSFILRNVLRDTVFAGIASKNGFIPIVDTVRGAIALAKDPAMRAEFEAAGVTEYNFYSSQKSRIKSLDAMAGETPASAWEIMKAVFSRLEATSDFFESSTRMGEYMKARQKGLSMEEAARAAREVTLDFSRSGRVGEQVNQVVPFFNACLQGGDKMVRLFREDFVGTSLKVFKYIVLPSLLIMAMNWDEDWYKDLDPDIKNNYWCLGRNIRIPKPQEAGVLFGSGIEALFQQAADKDKDAVSNFLKAFSSNMIPSVLPTLILPLIEWSANYSFFKGRPLVGNKYSRLPDELQYNDYTSELSKGIGSALKVSPMKIDNLVRGYTGTMGALLWSMAGEPFAKANNLPAKHFSELPFVRDFNVTDANLSRPMNEFYGILDKANRQHAGYGVKGKPEAAVKGIRSAGSMISKIRKDIDKITHSNLTPERKRELIDKRKEKMNQIAKQATARYGKYFE